MPESKKEDLAKYQSKSITPVDEYVCTLSPEIQEILKNEFRETEELRKHAIKALRDWTMQNSRIIMSRMDSLFLLKYLRLRKFNIPATQETIERYLVLRQSEWGQKAFHVEMDATWPCMQHIIGIGNLCMLEARDANKRPIIMVRGKDVPYEGGCLAQDILTGLGMMVEYMSEVEEFQARGVVYAIDCQHFSPNHLKLFTLDMIVKCVKNIEAMAAGRHKGFHFINIHPLIAFPLRLAFDCASAKWKERLKIHSSFDTFDIVDRKYLPSEYGGEKSFKELGKLFMDKVEERHELVTKYNLMRVNPACYPKAVMQGDTDMLNMPFSSPEFNKIKNSDDYGLYGNFRKLEID